MMHALDMCVYLGIQWLQSLEKLGLFVGHCLAPSSIILRKGGFRMGLLEEGTLFFWSMLFSGWLDFQVCGKWATGSWPVQRWWLLHHAANALGREVALV